MFKKFSLSQISLGTAITVVGVVIALQLNETIGTIVALVWGAFFWIAWNAFLDGNYRK
jgi:Na+/H+ antiporter NhaC